MRHSHSFLVNLLLHLLRRKSQQRNTNDDVELVAWSALEPKHITPALYANVSEPRREGLDFKDGAKVLRTKSGLQVCDKVVMLWVGAANYMGIVGNCLNRTRDSHVETKT